MTAGCDPAAIASRDGEPGRRRRRSSPLRLLRSQGGATAVEFAMLAPVFLFAVFVIAELALVFVVEELMDRAVTDTARLVRTGQVHAANMNKKEFQQTLCDNIIAIIDCESRNFYFDVAAYDSFAEVDFTPPVNEGGSFKGGGNTDFGGPSDIVVVRIYYQWPTSPMLGELSLANLENGRRLIGSMAAFRNEPFAPVAPGAGAGASASAGAGAAAGGGR